MYTFKILSVLTFCDVFSCTLSTSSSMILLQFDVICTCKLYKTTNCTRLFCCLWKIYLWLLTPNCTWNHAITYTKFHINCSGSSSIKEQRKRAEEAEWPSHQTGRKESRRQQGTENSTGSFPCSVSRAIQQWRWRRQDSCRPDHE